MGIIIGDLPRAILARPARPALPKSAGEKGHAKPPAPLRIVGLAACFNELSLPILGEGEPYREMMLPSCFRESIRRTDDITFVISHAADRPGGQGLAPDPLGSTREHTLNLFGDHRGLAFELLPQAGGGDYLIGCVRDRVFTGASIRFVVEEEEWERDRKYGLVRLIREARVLHICPNVAPRVSRDANRDNWLTMSKKEDSFESLVRSMRELVERDPRHESTTAQERKELAPKIENYRNTLKTILARIEDALTERDAAAKAFAAQTQKLVSQRAVLQEFALKTEELLKSLAGGEPRN